MDAIAAIYNVPYSILQPPRLKARRPGLPELPSAMTVFVIVMCTYLLVAGGIIYDLIIEPPSLGQGPDGRPTAFMAGRINGQFILEGLVSSTLFVCGGAGFILLDKAAKKEGKAQGFFTIAGLSASLIAYVGVRAFIGIKVPGYLM